VSIGFFIVGAVIFAFYMYFTLWNIVHSSKKQREENYPNVAKEETKLGKTLDKIFLKGEDTEK
jgi:ABC-type sugar transport system permease subunit